MSCEGTRVRSSHKREAAGSFEPFTAEGKVRVGSGREQKVVILRDAGANQTIVLESVLEGGRSIPIKGE